MPEQEQTSPTETDEAEESTPKQSQKEAVEEDGSSENSGDEQVNFTFDDTGITKEQLIEVLKDCYDPEIPVNLYDLGLIHEVRATGNKVEVDMTLTAPGCGFGPQIAKSVEARMLEEEEVEEAFVDIVHDPPWDRSMVSEEGQAQLNMLGF